MKAHTMNFGNLGDLSSLLDAPSNQNNGPIELALSAIEEDPNQPRKFFDIESLKEMALTIQIRGVKTPISVRINPNSEGNYIINHGARRFRATKLAGRETIPAFIDPDYTEADQVIENLQRENLTAREIADYIGREISKGDKQVEIAKKLGKSTAFISQHVTLLDLPEPIAKIFNSGRCRDITVINELVKMCKRNSKEVEIWLEDDEIEITRGSLKLFKEYLDSRKSVFVPNDHDSENISETEPTHEENPLNQKTEEKTDNLDKMKKAIVMINYKGNLGRIMLNKRPSEGNAWIKFEKDGNECEAKISDIRLTAIIEG